MTSFHGEPDNRLDVLVVGAGMMGSQIGVEYALAGHQVTLHSRDLNMLRERTAVALTLAGKHPRVSATAVSRASESIDFSASPGDVENADVIVESLPENLQLKTVVLRPLAESFPQATIASNTSSLSLTTLGAALGAPDRTLGTHYWNPPLLMPLVEIGAGEKTSPDRLDRIEEILRSLGKRPIRVADVPGFAWNRLQFALLREALWLVERGVLTPRAWTRSSVTDSHVAGAYWDRSRPFNSGARLPSRRLPTSCFRLCRRRKVRGASLQLRLDTSTSTSRQ